MFDVTKFGIFTSLILNFDEVHAFSYMCKALEIIHDNFVISQSTDKPLPHITRTVSVDGRTNRLIEVATSNIPGHTAASGCSLVSTQYSVVGNKHTSTLVQLAY